MVSKIICVLAVAIVGALSSAYGHGHAYSSQYVSRHDGPAHAVYIPKHGHGHSHGHGHKHSHDHGHGHDHSHGHIDYHAHPKYDFKYTVHDPHTGDYKSHHEDRDGDVVKGYYEFKEPDGSLRRVEYHADKHSGFHATVKHSTEHIVPKHHHHKKH